MGKLFPFIYDLVMKPLERGKFAKIRRSLIANAKGHVIELGSGSGINFPFYEKASCVEAIEPNRAMQERAMKRKVSHSIPIRMHAVKAEELPFADNTFDTVVATLVFCTIPDPHAAMKEVKRVSKPGAELLLFEHVRMDQPILGRAQNLLTPFWKKFCDGCHLNREPMMLLREYGFSVIGVEYYYRGLFLALKAVSAEG